MRPIWRWIVVDADPWLISPLIDTCRWIISF